MTGGGRRSAQLQVSYGEDGPGGSLRSVAFAFSLFFLLLFQHKQAVTFQNTDENIV